MKYKNIILRAVACALLSVTLSACVTTEQSSMPMYYQPSLYGHQGMTGPVAMEYYVAPRR